MVFCNCGEDLQGLDKAARLNCQRARTMKHIVNITMLVTVILVAGLAGGMVGLVFYALLNWVS
jgi:hypothetical protein